MLSIWILYCPLCSSYIFEEKGSLEETELAPRMFFSSLPGSDLRNFILRMEFPAVERLASCVSLLDSSIAYLCAEQKAFP